MKKKILLVDDNAELNRTLQMSLKDHYETISVVNGEDAVDLAVTEVPKLIIMDHMMLGMNGFEAIHLIRQVPKTPSIPIIVITAGLSKSFEEKCSRIGCDDYLAKPFTASQMSSSISKLLKQDRL